MYKIILTLIIAIGITQVHAQTSFKKGYVITLKKDTLSGTVAFYDGILANEACHFKPSDGQAQVNYLPGEIFGYGFNDDKFMESRTAVIDGVEKESFLEVVVRGTVTLFKVGEQFWVEKEAVGFSGLEISTSRKEVGDRAWVRNNNLHIATLNRMMYDCPKVKHDVETIELTKRALTKLVEKYNKCMGGPTVVYQESKPWARVVPNITAGVNYSKLEIQESKPAYEHLKGGSSWETSFIVGPSIDIFFPRFSERFAVTTALYYISAKYEIHKQQRYSAIVHDDYFSANLQQLKVPFGVKYVLGAHDFAPFINAGISLTYNISPELTWTEVNTEPTLNTTKNKDVPEPQIAQKGYWAGIGLMTPLTKKMNGVIEARIDRTNGLYATGSAMKSVILNYQLLLAIRWK